VSDDVNAHSMWLVTITCVEVKEQIG